jgi:hypothetical protein
MKYEQAIPWVSLGPALGSIQVGLRTESDLRTYPRVMLTLVELPFSSFTTGGTVRLTVDSGRTQVNDMNHQVREYRLMRSRHKVLDI